MTVSVLSTPSTSIVETTLSLARKPEISAVTILQSPRPSGAKSGASKPAIQASILPSPAGTIRKRKSKVCKNQMHIVAMKITVKARCRKSLVLSHRRCPTLRICGRR